MLMIGLSLNTPQFTHSFVNNRNYIIQDNDTTTVLNETLTLELSKTNTTAIYNDTLIFHYSFYASINTSTVFSFLMGVEFYKSNNDSNSFGEYVTTLNYYRYFNVNVSQEVQTTITVPSLIDGNTTLLVRTSIVNENTRNGSENYHAFNCYLQKNPFLTGIHFSVSIDKIDYNNDTETDFVDIKIFLTQPYYNYSPSMINQFGDQHYFDYTINIEISEYNETSSTVTRVIQSITTYHGITDPYDSKITRRFFPGKQGFYFVKIGVKLFGMNIGDFNDTFYSERSTWFYDQPHTFKAKITDLNNDSNGDSVLFSLNFPNTNTIRGSIFAEAQIRVFYYNTTINDYQYLTELYLFTNPSYFVWSENQVLYTPRLSGQYLFNVSLYDSNTMYLIGNGSYSYSFYLETPPIVYDNYNGLSWSAYAIRSNSTFSSPTNDTFTIRSELWGSTLNESYFAPRNITIQYNVFFNDSSYVLKESIIKTLENSDNYSVNFGDEFIYTILNNEFGEYLTNVSVYLDGVLYFTSSIKVILSAGLGILDIAVYDYGYGVSDTDNDNLSDSFDITIHVDLLQYSAPLNLTLVGEFYLLNEDTNQYQLVKTNMTNMMIQSHDVTFEKVFQIGIKGQFKAVIYFVDSMLRRAYVGDFYFSLDDNEINHHQETTNTTTSSATSTETSSSSQAGNNTSIETSSTDLSSSSSSETTNQPALPGYGFLVTLFGLLLIVSFKFKKRK